MASKTYNAAEDRANSEAAFERDQHRCVWCWFRLGIYSAGSVPHHIFGRRRNHAAEAQITLCMQRSQPDIKGNSLGCHQRFEQSYQVGGKIEITKQALIELMQEAYGISLNESY